MAWVESDTGKRPERQQVKQRLLAVMYGRAGHTGTAVGRAVDALYPGMRTEFGRHNAVSRGAFARALQRRESDLMIRGAAGAFVRKYPDEVCVTIHDCLLVRKHMADAAERLVNEVWAAAGYEAAVKVGPWTGA